MTYEMRQCPRCQGTRYAERKPGEVQPGCHFCDTPMSIIILKPRKVVWGAKITPRPLDSPEGRSWCQDQIEGW